MADEDKLINIIMRYQVLGAEDAKQGNADVTLMVDNLRKGAEFTTASLQKQSRSVQDLTREYRSMKMEARELGEASREIATVGGLMTAGLLLDAKNYVNAVGQTTQASAAWLAAEEQINQANLRIGESATQAALPALQQTSQYLQSLSTIVQDNPWLTQGILGAGGVLTAVSGIGMVVSQVMRTVAEAGLLATKLGITASSQYGVTGGRIGPATKDAATGGAGGLAVGALALTIGAFIGNELGNAINKAIGQHEQNFADNFMTIVRLLQLPMTLLVKGLGELIPGFTSTANGFITMENNLDHFAGSLLGASMDVEENAKKAAEAAAENPPLTDQQVQAYINYQDQMAKAEENHDRQRADTVEQFGQRMADSERQFSQQRAEMVANFADQEAQNTEDRNLAQIQRNRNFAEQMAQSEQQAHEQRAKTLQQANAAEIRAQEQRRIATQRAEQEHQAKVLDLAGQRDALGLVREQAAFARQKQQSAQDYNAQERERRQNLDTQLRDMDNAFQEQRARQIQQFNQQNADIAAQDALQDQRAKAQQAKALARLDQTHAQEMERLQKQESDTLARQDTAYKRQIEDLQHGLARQLEDLNLFMGNDRKLRAAYYAAETQDLQNWINANRGLLSSTATGGSTGGAAQFGIFHGHAAGGDAYGRVLVGERGPEMVSLPNGSYVHTNAETRAMAAMFASQGQAAQQGGRGGSLTVNLQAGSLTLSQVRAEISRALDMKLGSLVSDMLGV